MPIRPRFVRRYTRMLRKPDASFSGMGQRLTSVLPIRKIKKVCATSSCGCRPSRGTGAFSRSVPHEPY
jgi:hypothetical protein